MDFGSLLGSLKECTRPGCQTKFIPSDGRTEFCSDLCVVRARQQKGNVDVRPNFVVPTSPRQPKARQRQPQRQDRRGTALCPHGTKKTFVTADLAWEWIDANHADDPQIHPYRCQCGAIHIGHSGRSQRLERSV